MVIKNIHGSQIRKYSSEGWEETLDYLAVEEPLEIRLEFGLENTRKTISLAITMRTPGKDEALAAGFLYGENIIQSHRQIRRIFRPSTRKSDQANLIQVSLQPEVIFDENALQRNFYMTSSCGVCGKASIDAVRLGNCPVLPFGQPVINAALLGSLPEAVAHQQAIFTRTGGLHAAALFEVNGKLLLLAEDVGRHNALDKLVGEALLNDMLPLDKFIILLSGRASFELVQKTLRAGAPFLAAVGAPSSMAVKLAQRFKLTLVGFLKKERYNIYAGKERVQLGNRS